MLKSEIEIAPVQHRLHQRIPAHAMSCFMVIILQRVMRARLKQNPIKEVQSLERALYILRRVQIHRVTPAASKNLITSVSHLDAKQLAILNVFRAAKPAIATSTSAKSRRRLKSATQSWLGRSAVKIRLTRSRGLVASVSELVVRTRLSCTS